MKPSLLTNIKMLSVILIAVLFIFSCAKKEDIVDFPVKDKTLVLNCYFAPDSTWIFYISKSLSVIDNAELSYVTNAKLVLKEEGVVKATITNANFGEYYTYDGLNPQVGKKYEVEVSHPDYPTISASDILPSPVKLDVVKSRIIDSNLYYDSWLNKYVGEINANLTIAVNDPKGEENYYRFYMFYLDTFDGQIYRTELYAYETNNPVVENTYNSGLLFTDYLFDGTKYEISFKIQDYGYYTGKPYFFVLESMSRATYLYEKSHFMYLDMSGNPLSEPVQVFNNIKNGYGIFGGFSNDQKIYIIH